MLRLIFVCIAVVAMTGCQKNDDPRVHLSGKVTWKGQAIPAGHLLLSPDPTQGNSGAQGMAAIKNGEYDTRAIDGRPTMPGAVTVTVHGFDGQSGGEEFPRGKRLFMPYTMTLDIPADAETFDIEVPDDAEPPRY